MRKINELIDIKQLRVSGKMFLFGCITAFVITYFSKDIILPLAICLVLVGVIMGEEDRDKKEKN